jgi:hypothetical protein
MIYILRGLYYEYKVRAYEKKIMLIQTARNSLKAKQARATLAREKYADKVQAHRRK